MLDFYIPRRLFSLHSVRCLPVATMISTGTRPIVVDPSQAWQELLSLFTYQSLKLIAHLFRDGNDGPWSSFPLGIGNPPQFVRVLVSTTCPQPWTVLPQGCTHSDPPTCPSSRGGLFFPNSSTTWQEAGLYELDQELNLGYSGNGEFGFDSLTLGYPGSGAYTIDRHLLAGIAAKDFYIATWGIAPRPTNLTTIDSNNSYQSLLSSLKQNEQVPSLSYGYTAGAYYRRYLNSITRAPTPYSLHLQGLKQVLGSLTLGGYDVSRFVPSNVSFNFAEDNSRDLVVGLQSLVASTSDTKNISLLPNGILSFIDATVSHLWLPLESCQLFEKVFGIVWDPESDLYLVNDTLHSALLAQNANFTFQLGNDLTASQTIDITLPYQSFDLEATTAYPNVSNSTRYFPLRRAVNKTQYTLGRVFLQEAYARITHYMHREAQHNEQLSYRGL